VPPVVPRLLRARLRCRVCHAERGRWRPQADDTGFGFDFDFDFWFCPAGLTGRALLLFLTSPPRFHDGGVRSGTVCAAPFARPGRPAGHPRAARVPCDRTWGWAGVRDLCGRCAVGIVAHNILKSAHEVSQQG
jgi:hypothetical protein